MSRPLSIPAFLMVVLAFAGTAAHAAPGELPRVGVVDKVENQAEVVSARGVVAAIAGTPEIAATIAFPFTVSTAYAVIYNWGLWRRARGR